ncbi:MAG: glycosyltransferase [Bacteroidales bacterium]|jgi:glycosyltransferase involved in cell wall biosynthesis|nr:glycosyltransferase [Bacteroidales bacterium]NLB01920.1 glycosyltransferase [Bacteroidales bacterium]
MNNPLVSILILAYNQQEYIADCLDSALAQQGDFYYEIVLAEDASTDGTLQICKEYQRRYPDKIVLLSNRDNRGVVQNYFNALNHCRGEFIADCGGDDYWPDPLRLNKQLKLLVGDAAMSMVYGQWKTLKASELKSKDSAESQTSRKYDPADFGPQTAARFLNRLYKPEIVLSTALYRKSFVLEALQKNPDLFLNPDYRTEDLSVLTALLLRGPACYLPECFLVYRVQENSVSHSVEQDKYYRFAWSSFRQSLDWAGHIGLKLKEILPYLQSRYSNYLHYAFRAGDKQLARLLRKAVRGYTYRPSLKNELKYYLSQCSFKKSKAL